MPLNGNYFDTGGASNLSAYFIMMSPMARIISPCICIMTLALAPSCIKAPIMGQSPGMPYPIMPGPIMPPRPWRDIIRFQYYDAAPFLFNTHRTRHLDDAAEALRARLQIRNAGALSSKAKVWPAIVTSSSVGSTHAETFASGRLMHGAPR